MNFSSGTGNTRLYFGVACTIFTWLVSNDSLTAARNRLWVVAPSMLTGRRRITVRNRELLV